MNCCLVRFLCVVVITNGIVHALTLFRGFHLPSNRLSAGFVRPAPFLHRTCTALFAQEPEDLNWDPNSGPKLNFNEDYYSVLEVDPTISNKDLKKAYYKIVFKYHPDNKETKEEKAMSNKQMMVINTAYKTLKDVDARAKYDRKRMNGKSSTSSSRGPKSSSSSSSSSRSSSSSSTSGRSSSYNAYERTGNPYVDAFDGNNKYYQKNNDDDDAYVTTDSLEDILSELWSDIRKEGGVKNIFGDVLEFLEDQVSDKVVSLRMLRKKLKELVQGKVPYVSATEAVNDIYTKWGPGASNTGGSSGGSYTGGTSSGMNNEEKQRTKAKIDSEVKILQSAIHNLKAHMIEMMTTRADEKDKISSSTTTTSTSASSGGATDEEVKRRLAEMETRFRRLEAIKGLDARINEVDLQMKQLQRQLNRLLREQEEFTETTSRASTSSSSTSAYGTTTKTSTSSSSSTTSSSSSSSSASSSSSSSSYSNGRTTSSGTTSNNRTNNRIYDNVEDELIKLKKKMGL